MTATISSVRREQIEEAVKVTRWNRRLLFGAIAMLVPALAGCEAGAGAPTLEFHPASSGVSVIKDGINIDNVFVLGSALGSQLPAGGRAGVFLALQSSDGDRLESVSAPGTAASVQLAGGSVNLPQRTLVNLGGPVPKVVLTGLKTPLAGGQSIELVLTFAEAGAVTLDVPVVPRAYDYASYAPPPPTPTASPKPKASATGSATASPTATP
jgi:hypothetical protein